jgi:outer membrane biosynthesis protein TonB
MTRWLAYLVVSGGILLCALKLLEPFIPVGQAHQADEVDMRQLMEVSILDQRSLVAIEEPKPPEEPEEPEVDLAGQLVDVPEPEIKEKPEEAEYLAEHDRVVPEEMRSPDFRINPEVLADQYSEEDQIKESEYEDLDQTEPSTGAQIGNNRFDLEEDGAMAALPSPFTQTNLDGVEQPVPGGSTNESLAGSPNNDLVVEEVGAALQLNTKELIGASYINRIRRLVNYYWKQNLDNLPSSVLFIKPRYTTVIDVVLDGNGAVEKLAIILESGSSPLDNAVVLAFEIAGPFPNPPEQLIEEDGRVILPEMHWTVDIGHARAPYIGVDPRQGVQFPGILKAPR